MDEVVKVATDWRKAELDEQERTMLEFVEKVTFEQSRMTEEDVQRLHDVGFDDGQVLDIVLCAAYRNFITRVTDALGVRPESGKYDAELLGAFSVEDEESRPRHDHH